MKITFLEMRVRNNIKFDINLYDMFLLELLNKSLKKHKVYLVTNLVIKKSVGTITFDNILNRNTQTISFNSKYEYDIITYKERKINNKSNVVQTLVEYDRGEYYNDLYSNILVEYIRLINFTNNENVKDDILYSVFHRVKKLDFNRFSYTAYDALPYELLGYVKQILLHWDNIVSHIPNEAKKLLNTNLILKDLFRVCTSLLNKENYTIFQKMLNDLRSYMTSYLKNTEIGIHNGKMLNDIIIMTVKRYKEFFNTVILRTIQDFSLDIKESNHTLITYKRESFEYYVLALVISYHVNKSISKSSNFKNIDISLFKKPYFSEDLLEVIKDLFPIVTESTGYFDGDLKDTTTIKISKEMVNNKKVEDLYNYIRELVDNHNFVGKEVIVEVTYLK